MKKIVITGASGFVGKHLINYLVDCGVRIWATTRSVHKHVHTESPVKWEYLDLLKVEQIYDLLQKVKPDVIFHLAGQSNVRESWDDKPGTFQSNVIASIHLLEAVKNVCPDAVVLTVGSSEEYGIVANDEMPISETVRPNPGNPYGISKLAIGMLARQYAHTSGLNVIHVRPFNHIGQGQSLGFVTTDFAKQIVSIEKGMHTNQLFVGNLDGARDFTDVRDIVRAYWELSQKGRPGEIYNVCSGQGVKISTILLELTNRSNINIEIVHDPSKYRPVDIPLYVGDNRKIKMECGWSPMIPLSQTLDDIMEDWRNRLSRKEGSEIGVF